jgi:hypothetical protein
LTTKNPSNRRYPDGERQKKNSRKKPSSKGVRASRVKANKINVSKPYKTCIEQLSLFERL